MRSSILDFSINRWISLQFYDSTRLLKTHLNLHNTLKPPDDPYIRTASGKKTYYSDNKQTQVAATDGKLARADADNTGSRRHWQTLPGCHSNLDTPWWLLLLITTYASLFQRWRINWSKQLSIRYFLDG